MGTRRDCHDKMTRSLGCMVNTNSMTKAWEVIFTVFVSAVGSVVFLFIPGKNVTAAAPPLAANKTRLTGGKLAFAVFGAPLSEWMSAKVRAGETVCVCVRVCVIQ